MRRREFIGGIAGTACVLPLVARAQSAPMRRISLLMLYPEKDPQAELRARTFQRELEKAGWTVGGNVQLDFYWGTGNADWVRSALMQIISVAPDVILANGDISAKTAQQSTKTIPVIFIGSGDPVADGLVESLAYPGANLTGFAVMEPTLGAKLLGMLKQVAPQIGHVGVLMNPDSLTHQRIFALLTDGAGRFSVDVVEASVVPFGTIEFCGEAIPAGTLMGVRRLPDRSPPKPRYRNAGASL
jgi:putative tryptophan/tyrosine transport system substrate-binding protein